MAKTVSVNRESSWRNSTILQTESVNGPEEPINRPAFPLPPPAADLPTDPGNLEAELQESPFWAFGLARPPAEAKEDLPSQALEPLDPIETDLEKMYYEVDIQPRYWNPS